MTTRTRASAEDRRGLSAPGASAVARPLSRGGAAESAPPTPGGRPRYRQADGGPPLRALWHRGCPPRAGAAGPSNGASHCLAGQDHRQGRSLRSRRHGDRRKRRPLSSDLPRKEHRHLSGWTEPPVDSVRALGSIETTFHGSSRDLPATAHLVLAPTRKRSRAGPDDRGQDEARAVKAVDAPGWSRPGRANLPDQVKGSVIAPHTDGKELLYKPMGPCEGGHRTGLH